MRFFGATVNEVQNVRRELRAAEMSYRVIKKTLISAAAKKIAAVDFTPKNLDGAVAVIISEKDSIAPIAAVKKLKKDFFNKKTKKSKFDFAGAIFEKNFLDEKKSAELAEIPSREESIAKIIGAMRNGPRKIHSTLLHGLRGICAACRDAEKFAEKK